MKNKLAISSAIGAMLLVSAAMPVLADNATSTGAQGQALPVACIQAAISKRDGAVSSAIGAYSAAAQSALSARTSALNAAWSQTDKKVRRSALNAAWKAFEKSSKDARKSLRDARHNAWTGFRSDMKACGAKNESGESEGADMNL